MQCKEPWKNVSYKIKGYFRYKTTTTQKVSFEAQVQIFFILSKVMFRSQDIQVFVYLTIPYDLPNLFCHDEYYYLRQGAFLNISYEPQLVKSPNLANWYI